MQGRTAKRRCEIDAESISQKAFGPASIKRTESERSENQKSPLSIVGLLAAEKFLSRQREFEIEPDAYVRPHDPALSLTINPEE
jgi:hypothetical protein